MVGLPLRNAGFHAKLLTSERLRLINRLAGLVITAFGVVLIASLFVATDIV